MAALIVPAVLAAFAVAGSTALAMRDDVGSLQWTGGFETGDLSQWRLQEKDPSRIVVVQDPRREGQFAVRVIVTPGDSNVFGSGSGQRAELALTQATTDGYEGREQWWAWSTMFATDFTSVASDWNNFTQFHQTGPTGQSNVRWAAAGKLLRFSVCNGDPNAAHCRSWTIDSNRQNGRWYDFVFHVKWSSSYAGGLVELWENGRKVVPLTQLRTLYPGLGVYLKQGFYRVAQSSTAVIYHDGMRRGMSYAAVVKDFPPGEWPSIPPGSPGRRPYSR